MTYGPFSRVRGREAGSTPARSTTITLAPGGRQEAGSSPGGGNPSLSTLAFSVGIDYDAGMTMTADRWAAQTRCPWCGEAEPGEQSGLTTCCAEPVTEYDEGGKR